VSGDIPTKEQIDATSDLEALAGWQQDIEIIIEKIKVDLEFSGKDDDWYNRARNALSYHAIALKRITTRIYKLTKKTNGDVHQAIQNKEAKAHKKEAHAKQIEKLNEQKRIDAERRKLTLQEETMKFLARTSQASIFRKMAAKILDNDIFSRIEQLAHDEYIERLNKELKTTTLSDNQP